MSRVEIGLVCVQGCVSLSLTSAGMVLNVFQVVSMSTNPSSFGVISIDGDAISCSKSKLYGGIEHRSIPKQIEYWSQIGKIAQENPDLPFSMIREILIADKEPVVGEYVFG